MPNKQFDLKSIRRLKILRPKIPESKRNLSAEHIMVLNAHAYPAPYTKKGYPHHRRRFQYTKRTNHKETASTIAIDDPVKRRSDPDVYLYTRDTPFETKNVIDLHDPSLKVTTSAPIRGRHYKSHAKYVHSHTKLHPFTNNPVKEDITRTRSLERFRNFEFKNFFQPNFQYNDYFDELANISDFNTPVKGLLKETTDSLEGEEISDIKKESQLEDDSLNFGDARPQYTDINIPVIKSVTIQGPNLRISQPEKDELILSPVLEYETVKVAVVTPVNIFDVKTSDEPSLVENSLDDEDYNVKHDTDFNVKVIAVTPVSDSGLDEQNYHTPYNELEDFRSSHFKGLDYFTKITPVTPEGKIELQLNDEYSQSEDDSNEIENLPQKNEVNYHIKVTVVSPISDSKLEKDLYQPVEDPLDDENSNLKYNVQFKVPVVTPVSPSDGDFSQPGKDYYDEYFDRNSSFTSKSVETNGEYVSKVFSASHSSSKKHQLHFTALIKDSFNKYETDKPATKDSYPDSQSVRFVKYGLPIKGTFSDFLYKRFTTESFNKNVSVSSNNPVQQDYYDTFYPNLRKNKTKYLKSSHIVKFDPYFKDYKYYTKAGHPYLNVLPGITKFRYEDLTTEPYSESDSLDINASSSIPLVNFDYNTKVNYNESGKHRLFKFFPLDTKDGLDNVIEKYPIVKPHTKVNVTKFGLSVNEPHAKNYKLGKIVSVAHKGATSETYTYSRTYNVYLTNRNFTLDYFDMMYPDDNQIKKEEKTSPNDNEIQKDRKTSAPDYHIKKDRKTSAPDYHIKKDRKTSAPDYHIKKEKKMSAHDIHIDKEKRSSTHGIQIKKEKKTSAHDIQIDKEIKTSPHPYFRALYSRPKYVNNNKLYRLSYTPSQTTQDLRRKGDTKLRTIDASQVQMMVQEYMSHTEGKLQHKDGGTWLQKKFLMLPPPYTNSTRPYPEHEFMHRLLKGLPGIMIEPLLDTLVILLLLLAYFMFRVCRIEMSKNKSNKKATKRPKPVKSGNILALCFVMFLIIILLDIGFQCSLLSYLPMTTFNIEKEQITKEFRYAMTLACYKIKIYSDTKHTANRAWENDPEMKNFSVTMFNPLSEEYERFVEYVENSTDLIKSKDQMVAPHVVQSLFKQSSLHFGWVRYVITISLWSMAVGVCSSWMRRCKSSIPCAISGIIFCTFMAALLVGQMVAIAEFCREPNLILVGLKDSKLYNNYLNSRMAYLCKVWHHVMRDRVRQYQRTTGAAIAYVKRNRAIIRKQNSFENYLISFDYDKVAPGIIRTKYNDKWQEYLDVPILDLDLPIKCNTKYKFSDTIEDATPLCQQNRLLFWLFWQLILLSVVAVAFAYIIVKHISAMTEEGVEKSKFVKKFFRSPRKKGKKQRNSSTNRDEEENCGLRPMACPSYHPEAQYYTILTAKDQVSRNIFKRRLTERRKPTSKTERTNKKKKN